MTTNVQWILTTSGMHTVMSAIRPHLVSFEYLRAAELIMHENNITHMPTDITEALHLYFLLVGSLEMYASIFFVSECPQL